MLRHRAVLSCLLVTWVTAAAVTAQADTYVPPCTGCTPPVIDGGDEVVPPWFAATDLVSGSITATVQVWDADNGGNDHYDVTPERGASLDPFFLIDHLSGAVRRVDGAGQVLQLLGSFETSQGGFALDTTGSDGERATASHLITAEEID